MMRAYDQKLSSIGSGGYCCGHCGQVLMADDLVAECQKCAAIFCEECVAAGVLDKHRCDDYEEESEYEPMTWHQDGDIWITTICAHR